MLELDDPGAPKALPASFQSSPFSMRAKALLRPTVRCLPGPVLRLGRAWSTRAPAESNAGGRSSPALLLAQVHVGLFYFAVQPELVPFPVSLTYKVEPGAPSRRWKMSPTLPMTLLL